MRARPDVLNRDIPKPLRSHCQEHSEFIEQCVNVGTHVIDWIQPAINESGIGHTSVLMLYRHLLDMLDGFSVLISRSCVEATKPLLRSALEAKLGLGYMLDADTERRGLAYHVADIHNQIAFFSRVDKSTEQGRQVALNTGESIDQILSRVNVDFARRRRAMLQESLQQPGYAEVEAEWQRRKHKSSNPNWFSLFDGPNNIEHVAKHLAETGWYEWVYRDLSGTAHGTNALRQAIKGPDGWDVMALRSQVGMTEMTLAAIQIFLDASLALLPFALERFPEWDAWFNTELQPMYDQLTT